MALPEARVLLTEVSCESRVYLPRDMRMRRLHACASGHPALLEKQGALREIIHRPLIAVFVFG